MIRMLRDRKSLPPGLIGAKLVQKNIKLAEAFLKKKSHSFKSDWWKEGKNTLKAESHGKCSYCEAPTSTVAHGDVEHFRPKSIYWWLAYTFDNHLFSCQICNQTYKSNWFELLDGYQRMETPRYRKSKHKDAKGFALYFGYDPGSPQDVLALKIACEGERALLIDPYQEDPEDFLAWDEISFPGEVHAVPRSQRGNRKKRAMATIEHLGLNREELRRARWDTFERLQTLKDAWQKLKKRSPVREQVQRYLQGMQDPGAPFAAMVRYFVRDEWQLSL